VFPPLSPVPEPHTTVKKAVLINDTRIDQHHGCLIAVSAIYKLAERHGIQIVASSPAHLDWKTDEIFVNAAKCADIIIINGEGTLHHERPAGYWLLEAAPWAQRNGIPIVLINATWQANSQDMLDKLQYFDLISVRESCSAKEILDAGFSCLTVPDLAMLFDWKSGSNRHGIVFTDCVIGNHARELNRLRRTHGGSPLNLLFARTGLKDITQSLKRFLDRDDLLNIHKLLGALAATRSDYYSQVVQTDQFVDAMCSSNLLVTGRFHAMIIALATRSPFLAIPSNTHKIEATIRDAGLESWRHVEINNIDSETMDRCANWQNHELETLENFLRTSRKDMDKLFEQIRLLCK